MPDWTPTDSTPTDADSPRGVRGWFQRRAEALLRKPGRALPALREPGDRQVVLQVRGAKPIPVITVICQATGLDFVSAQALAHDAPIVVVAGISEASANRVVERLHKAGAKAVVGEAYRPQ